jgi:hypothetical protein
VGNHWRDQFFGFARWPKIKLHRKAIIGQFVWQLPKPTLTRALDSSNRFKVEGRATRATRESHVGHSTFPLDREENGSLPVPTTPPPKTVKDLPNDIVVVGRIVTANSLKAHINTLSRILDFLRRWVWC